jgi:hypothetical protein
MMRSSICTSILILSLLGCGGSGGGDDSPDTVVVAPAPTPEPTPILVTQCGDVTVDLEAVDEIVAAAEEEGADITDEPEVPGLNQDLALKGVIIANCGSTVVTNDSVNDNDTVTVVQNPTPAQRLVAAIRAGEVVSIEVRR